MKLIIGIGNPDPQYQQTRHNVGFMFLDFVAKSAERRSASGGILWVEEKKLNALVIKTKLDKFPIILAKPLCYVNKSGEVVAKLAKLYKVKPKDVIVVQDDLDIEFGTFKNSFEKNSGGHKGIESVIKALKTNKFYRLRIGTSVRALEKAREQSDKKRDAFVVDFVLAKFTPKEQDIIKKMFPKTYDRLLMLLKQ